MRTPKTRACSPSTRTADPLGHAAGVLARLPGAAGDKRLDTDAARFFGPAALVVGAFDLGNDFLAAAVDGLRTEGRLGHLPRLLTLYSSMAARIGDWDVALTAADEARRLAEEFAEPQWAAAADTAISLVAAMRGDEPAGRAHGRTSRDGRGAGGREHHDGVRPVRQSAGRARHRSPRRGVRSGGPPVPAGRLGLPPGDLVVADRGSRRGRAPHRPARRRARTGGAGRGERRRAARHLDRARAPSCPGAGRGAGGRRRSLRRGAGERPHAVAVPARQASARLRPVAATAATCRRVPGRPAGRARHVRCARLRAVGRAGAP